MTLFENSMDMVQDDMFMGKERFKVIAWVFDKLTYLGKDDNPLTKRATRNYLVKFDDNTEGVIASSAKESYNPFNNKRMIDLHISALKDRDFIPIVTRTDLATNTPENQEKILTYIKNYIAENRMDIPEDLMEDMLKVIEDYKNEYTV